MQRWKMAVSPLLLLFTLVLQAALSLEDGGGQKACRPSNYQHGCRDGGVCEFSVSWRRASEAEASLRLSALVPKTAKGGWRVELSLTSHSVKAEFMCLWRSGKTSYNCSVGCLAATVTRHNTTLECRFSLAGRGVWSELASEPVSLHISSGTGSTGVEQWSHQASSKCPCNLTNCADTCGNCVSTIQEEEKEDEDDKCHSALALLLIRSHAILMVVTFLLLLPVGVSISRYSRPVFPHSWFRAHALTNSTAVILMLLGLAAVLGHTRGSFSVGFHQIAGVVCISLVLFQALCGYLRPAIGVSLQRRVFNAVHRTCGMAILGIGTLAMILGSVMYRNSVYPLIVLVLVVALVVETFFFLGMEIIMRRNYMISVPVGYQRVDGADEDEGEEREGKKGCSGEGEGDKKDKSGKSTELQVMNGKVGKEKTTASEQNSKPRPSHVATKRVLEAFTVQAFLFSAAIGVLISYGSH